MISNLNLVKYVSCNKRLWLVLKRVNIFKNIGVYFFIFGKCYFLKFPVFEMIKCNIIFIWKKKVSIQEIIIT